MSVKLAVSEIDKAAGAMLSSMVSGEFVDGCCMVAVHRVNTGTGDCKGRAGIWWLKGR